MSRKGLVLAAHGSTSQTDVNDSLRRLAQQLEKRRLFTAVGVSFHQGDPPFAEILDRMDSDEILVIPFMASQGYYADVVLPRELARNSRFRDVSLVITPAVGTHLGAVDLVAQRVQEGLTAHGMDPAATTLALIGHGTSKHDKSRDSTLAVAEAIVDRGILAEVLCAFLDDEPPVETLRERIKTRNVIIEPFLMNDAFHAAQDVPRRLGLDVLPGTRMPFVYHTDRGLTVCQSAFGTDERIIDILFALCRKFAGAVPSATQ